MLHTYLSSSVVVLSLLEKAKTNLRKRKNDQLQFEKWMLPSSWWRFQSVWLLSSFLDGGLLLTRQILNQEFLVVKLKSSLRLLTIKTMTCSTEGTTCGANTETFPKFLTWPVVLKWVGVARCFFFCVVFIYHCLSSCHLSLAHCTVCPFI